MSTSALPIDQLPGEREFQITMYVNHIDELNDIFDDALGRLYDLNNSELLIYFPEADWGEMYDDHEIQFPSVWDC
ncbi:MAG: hypothetical protein KQH59_12900 [Desulfobulbaceae bacterium]|nr:hypothetical protein [Desulfobulbaceae bacterium]